MADNLRKFTTQEVLNKVYSDSSGNSIGINAATSKETLNAALDTSNSRLNVSLAGGTIDGDIVITGDLQVNGGGSLSFDEIIQGTQVIDVTNTEALLVRKNDDGGDVFVVDTTNSKVTVSGSLGVGASPVSSFPAQNVTIEGATAGLVLRDTTGSNQATQFFTLYSSNGDIIGMFDDSKSLKFGHADDAVGTNYEDVLTLGSDKSATFSGNVKITKAESSASEFISALEINRDYGSATGTDLLTGMIFTDDNSVQAGIFTNRYNSAGSYNSRLQFYVNNSSSSMTPQTALGDPALIIDESKNATFAGRVTISSAFTASELLGVKGSVGSDWGARIENTSSTGAGALIKSATTNAGVQLFQVRSGSDNVFTIMGDQNATFAGNVTVNGSTTTPMTISADTDKVFTLSSGIGETDNVPTIQTINTAGSALVGFGVRASVINLVTGSAKRLVLDDNSRISLSNNDSGTSNTVFGKLAGASIDAGSNYNTFIGENVADASLDDAIYNSAIGYSTLSALTSGDYNTAIGSRSLLQVNSGSQNTALGYYSGYGITTGANNVHIGALAGEGNTGASYLVGIGDDTFRVGGVTSDANGAVAVGYQALRKLTSGTTNTAVGYLASTSITTGSNNISLGYQALDTVTTGSDNIAIGTNALGNITNSSQKTIAIGTSAGFNGETDEGVFIGYAAGSSGTSTSATDGAVGIGKQSLVNITSGAGATAVGYQSLKAMTSGANNTAVGYEAGDALTVGAENVALGSNALGAEVEGVSNTAIGYDALKIANAGGSNGAGTTTANTALGTQAGNALTTGKFNTFLGAGTDASANSGENQTVVGFGATGAGDNSVVLGNSDVTAVLCASDGEAQVYASAIRFPATQVGNSNDNALDDYEEGLYTPSITGSSSGNFVLNASFDRTSYTKIGRQVTYTGEIRIASDNSTSGEIRFSLPFDSADLTDTAGKSVSTSVYLSGHGDANIDSNKLLIYIEENSSFFRIAHVADDDTFAYLTHANVDGAWNLAFTLTYFTS